MDSHIFMQSMFICHCFTISNRMSAFFKSAGIIFASLQVVLPCSETNSFMGLLAPTSKTSCYRFFFIFNNALSKNYLDFALPFFSRNHCADVNVTWFQMFKRFQLIIILFFMPFHFVQ